jgi:hypothetical protein
MRIVSQFVWALGGSDGVEPRPEGGLVVWARFPESTMVPGGVFGLPEAPGDESDVDADPDVDLGLDGLDDDDLLDSEAEAQDSGGLQLPPPRQQVRP